MRSSDIQRYGQPNAKFNRLTDIAEGYEETNKNIELLRLRNFTMGKKLKDDEVLGRGGLQRIVDLLGTLTPFVSHVASSVTEALRLPQDVTGFVSE